MFALMSLIKENLIRAEVRSFFLNSIKIDFVKMFLCWKENDTYNEVTRLRYASVHHFPLNYILPTLKRREILGFLSDIGYGKMSLEDVVNKAESCFQALSIKLGSNKYIIGNEPTELDALAFGHLYTILTTDLPTMDLSNLLRKYPNLLKYCYDLDTEWFKR